jgi:uncharacterized protein (TIGR02453 family)
MTFFTDESVTFWRGLAEHNNKAWFDEHRKDYERHLRGPYNALAEALVEQLEEVEPEYTITAKEAAYRINRDTRFSPDKTPYKTELGITIGRSHKHDPDWPGYTVRIGVDKLAVAGGLYRPGPELRDKVRVYVGEHAAELAKIERGSTRFAKTFGRLQGEAHKRTPAALKEVAAIEPRVLNTQWVFWAEFDDPDLFTNPKLDQFILDQWEIARPAQEFLKAAVSS